MIHELEYRTARWLMVILLVMIVGLLSLVLVIQNRPVTKPADVFREVKTLQQQVEAIETKLGVEQ